MDDVRIRILVLDRGYVLVARCPDPKGVGIWLPITESRTIRRWGTTRGLGELRHGPTDSTVLDDEFESEDIPVRAVIRVILVEQEPWQKHLSRNSSAERTAPSDSSSSPTGSRARRAGAART